MWIFLSLLSAIAFSAVWLLVRASRGIPSSIVTAAQYSLGPVLLLLTVPHTALPWNEPIWYVFLCINVLIVPIASWTMVLASHRVPITVSNPLLGLSSVASLITAALFFHGTFTVLGVIGILTTTFGLFILYHGRWTIWRTRYPWMVLVIVILYGINGTIGHRLLQIFPHPFLLGGIFLSSSFVVPLRQAVRRARGMQWSRDVLFLLFALAIAMLAQDIATLLAFQLAPAPYVLSIKRMSVLFSMLGGYFLFREREASLKRLVLATIVVLAGVALMTVA